jgi:hypothetical protein
MLRSGWTALLLFAGLSICVTWPLAAGLGRDVPGDYGDPLYVAWALAWVSRQTGLVLTGHLDALTGFWRGNQLHPEPAALALSDSFIGQALPLMPVYWATENALLMLGWPIWWRSRSPASAPGSWCASSPDRRRPG